ncbi:hypothetical protein AAD018_009385 [Aestuariibius insulae]
MTWSTGKLLGRHVNMALFGNADELGALGQFASFTGKSEITED